MANNFITPGLYIAETPSLPPSIAAVETAIPAFIGFTEKAVDHNGNALTEPLKIQSLLEYERHFGRAKQETAIEVSIRDTKLAGILNRKITASIDPIGQSPFLMAYAMQLFFANGGRACYVSSAGDYSQRPYLGDAVSGLLAALNRLAACSDITLLLLPEMQALPEPDYYKLAKAAMDQSAALRNRFLILDLPQKSNLSASLSAFRGAAGAALGSIIGKLKYVAAYFPNLVTAFNYEYSDANVVLRYFQDGSERTDRDGLPLTSLLKLFSSRNTTIHRDLITGLGLPNKTLYAEVKQAIQKLTVTLPSSPAVAGVYTVVDTNRGVWKAPANQPLNAVLAPAMSLGNQEQELMNIDAATGKSVNAIRHFPGKGILVWGARTLAGNDNEWRYVPVMRYYIFLETSIQQGTAWVVFEPNNANTWIRLKAAIENFLQLQWRAGALQGIKPEQAYFVRVGLGKTMTAADITNGRLIVELGFAPVRPAEFVIMRFTHQLRQN